MLKVINAQLGIVTNNVYQLEDPLFKMDTWDLYEVTKDIELCKKIGIRYFHFENITNECIRSQFKTFAVNLLDTKALSTTHSYVKTMNALNGFLEEYYSGINSILVLNKSKILEEYTTWLTKNNYVTKRNTRDVVLENMTKKKYQVNTMYIITLNAFYNFVEEQFGSNQVKEYDKDIWDVRHLNLPVQILESRPRYTVNFEQIKQQDFKLVCKQYVYHRLKNKSVSTVICDMKALNNFSAYLYNSHPHIKFKEINREIMEGFFRELRCSNTLKTETFKKRIGILKVFFDTIQLLGIENIPSETLIANSDYRRKDKTAPKYFSEEELKQINKHMNELPIQIARMLFVIQNIGLRISDLCSLKCDCLKKNNNEEYTLRYYQPKSKKWNNIPIDEIVATTIEAAIRESKSNYGEECNYVFAYEKNKPISSETFSDHLNQLSSRFNLKHDSGKQLRIKSHTFRGTVATKYANLGIDLNIICMMLGQSSAGVLKHYVSIHDINMIDALKEITEEDNKLIENIGNIDKVIIDCNENKEYIPLPNGNCTKSLSSGKCNHANACYTCRMFRPSKIYLSLYKHQLSQAENNIEVAKLNGFERLLEMNVELKVNLEKIINTLEMGG